MVFPTCMNLVLLGLYFSGNQFAQYLVAPQFDWLHHRSWREFGLVEQLQNLYLLTIVVLFIGAFFKRSLPLERLFFLCGAGVILFLLLEEVDYGIHFYEYAIGHEVSLDANLRNWHNDERSGEAVTKNLKKITSAVMLFWFILLPLISAKVDLGALNGIIPSRWFIAGFAVSLLFSSLVHFLSDNGMDIINGVEGSLKGNISEFRETSTYYLYMLYAVQLLTTATLFPRGLRKEQGNA